MKAREAKRDPSGKNGGKACVRELGSASKERDHVRFHFFSLHIKHSASSGGNALRVWSLSRRMNLECVLACEKTDVGDGVRAEIRNPFSVSNINSHYFNRDSEISNPFSVFNIKKFIRYYVLFFLLKYLFQPLNSKFQLNPSIRTDFLDPSFFLLQLRERERGGGAMNYL